MMRIAVLSRGIMGGGVQGAFWNVAEALVARGYQVDLLVPKHRTAGEPPRDVNVVPLTPVPRLMGQALAWRADPGGWRQLLRPVLAAPVASESLRFLAALEGYLKADPPDALISATTYLNLAALWARRRAGAATRILVSERDNLAQNLATGKRRRAARWRHLPPLLGRTYPWAEAIVTVSEGVGDDLAKLTGIDRERIQTIYNPVYTDALARSVASPEPTGDVWFDGEDRTDRREKPLIVSAGRLVEKKRFDLLLRAFADLKARRSARLAILGEGPVRSALEAQTRELGLQEDVRFLGWVDRPAHHFAKADLFAMASEREGLGNVLIEVLATGCPIVSTDCPSGPAEILGGGVYGRLVPVGDVGALTKAMEAALDDPGPRDARRERAKYFSSERTVDGYLDALGLPRRV